LTERNAALMRREEELVASNHSLEDLAIKLERKSEEYADARNRADTANQAKSQFLANMSHELRTPLNAIIGFAELIAAMPADRRGHDKSSEYASYVKDAGAHLLNVVNNLLDLARIELNAIEVSREPIALEELVRRAKLLVQFALTAKQIEITTEMPSGLILAVDPQLMRQALVNVLGNAIKFSPQGSVIRLTAKSLSNGVLNLAISDSGPGIDSAVREKVFEPFAQAGDVHSRTHGGVGLGLSITRRIIEAHNGTIEARPAPNGGTEILICLPVEALTAA
jgi:two-component system cell cycle sensor histidine kinase PleC